MAELDLNTQVSGLEARTAALETHLHEIADAARSLATAVRLHVDRLETERRVGWTTIRQSYLQILPLLV